MQRKARLSRRELLALGGVTAVAGIGSLALRRLQPVGTLLPDSPVVRAALAETAPIGGNSAGNLTMLVFTDYNCPVCRPTHRQMMAAVDRNGGVRVKFLDWPIFGDDSRAAARVAIAADAQGLYLPVHAALMQGGGRANARTAERALADAGGNVDRLRQTLTTDAARIEGQLSRNAVHAFGLGLGGTPGHLIGHLRLLGRTSESEFRRAFKRAL